MALLDSNTYIEPTAGTSLSTARGQQNSDFRSLLQNFTSAGPPVGVNIVISGAASGEKPGMLWHNATDATHALYMSDANQQKSGITGTNFTRRGLAFRAEESISDLAANATTYEIGESVATVTNSSTANARLYLRASNAATGTEGFVDIGIPPENASITTAMLGDASVTTAKTYFRGNITDANAFIDVGAAGNTTLALFGNADTNLGNVGITFNSANATSNVGLKIYASGDNHSVGANSGLFVTTSNGRDLAPIGANTILQSITGASSTVTASQTVAPLIPPGAIIAWGSSSAPDGWHLCNDSAIARTTYAGLFAEIGTTYGVGNGSTTFNVPDLRDRLPLGAGSNNTIGGETAQCAASGVVTTASGTAALTLTTASFAQSAKDSSTATAVTNATAGGHTHATTLPIQVVSYIIKT